MTTAGIAIDQFVANLSQRSFREAYLHFITNSGQPVKTFCHVVDKFLRIKYVLAYLNSQIKRFLAVKTYILMPWGLKRVVAR